MKLHFLKEVGLKENPVTPINNITVVPLSFVSYEVSEIILRPVEI